MSKFIKRLFGRSANARNRSSADGLRIALDEWFHDPVSLIADALVQALEELLELIGDWPNTTPRERAQVELEEILFEWRAKRIEMEALGLMILHDTFSQAEKLGVGESLRQTYFARFEEAEQGFRVRAVRAVREAVKRVESQISR